MSILYQAEGFFTQGKITMVQNPAVNYVNINITTNRFEFIGKNVQFPGIIKNSIGFRFDIPWSNIKNINKTKARMMHVIIIETLDNFYTILPLDPHSSGLGISRSKKNAFELLATINKAKAQIQVEKSNIIFCTNCGEKLKPASDFCGNCGHKVS